eukprot:5331658-Prymnesium_polylepis.2
MNCKLDACGVRGGLRSQVWATRVWRRGGHTGWGQIPMVLVDVIEGIGPWRTHETHAGAVCSRGADAIRRGAVRRAAVHK